MWRTTVVLAFLISSIALWVQAQQSDREPITSVPPAFLSELVHKDFKDCLIDPPHPRPRLYAQETFEFTGNAERLNTFLAQLAQLRGHHPTTIYLCGPGHSVVQPLSSAVAQAAVEYDWKVQTFAENISVFIPLASRIPFADIRFPDDLGLQAEPTVQPITDDFIRLREQELDSHNKPLMPKE